MPQIFDFVSITSLLVILAVGTYVLGLLFRDQLYIRLLVVIGSSFYMVFYWVQGPEPLWDAIIGSALIAMASGQGILRILWSRHASSVPRRNRHIFQTIKEMEPGLFNRLMKAGSNLQIKTPTILTREGTRPEALWLLTNGSVSLERKDHPPIMIDSSGFIGEIAWMQKGNASATVVAQPGAELIRWDYHALSKVVAANHRLELALDAAIANDIARKLAKSRPVEALDPHAVSKLGT